jgi:hypothetical protein
VPRGWALVYRDCGAWTVTHRESGFVLLRVDALPCADQQPWIDGIASALSTLFDLARTQGQVEVQPAAEEGALAFALTWGQHA